MSSQNKKFTFKKVFIAALISLLVLSAFLFGRLDSITDSTPGGHKTVLPGDDGKIYASLHDKEQSSVAVYPEISNEQVIALLNEATNQQSDYTWYYKSTLISRDRSLSENGILKSSDNTYRVDIFDGNNTLQKTVEVNDAVMSVQLFNVASGQSEKDFSSESASIFEEIGVPEIYDFINSEDKDFSFSLSTAILESFCLQVSPQLTEITRSTRNIISVLTMHSLYALIALKTIFPYIRLRQYRFTDRTKEFKTEERQPEELE